MSSVRTLPSPPITVAKRADADLALPLQVARESARAEGVDWDALPAHERMERVHATNAVIVAYQSIVTEVPGAVGINRFPEGSRHAAFVDGMLWHLGQVPFPTEVRRVHAEALRRFGPVNADAELDVAHG